MRKAQAAVMPAAPDEEPELIVDREFRNPRPLDRNISTVSLKTPTNNVSLGYDLMLSATFGKERIILFSDEIEVDFSMDKANIELSFHHCDSTEINDAPRVEEYRRTISEQVGKKAKAIGLSRHYGAWAEKARKGRSPKYLRKVLAEASEAHRRFANESMQRDREAQP
jgi:hypothetical protein